MTLPGAEIGEASTTESGKPRQLFGLLSQQGSMSEMELPVTESTPVALKSPPPAAKAKIDKENLTLADRIRSPALDTSCSKDQWRTIAIQAAARANGDVYEEWRDMAPMRALDLQPEEEHNVDNTGPQPAMSGQPLAAHSQAEPTFQVLTVNAEHVESAVEVVPTHKDESQISGSMQETETTMAALECHEANTDTDACTDSTDRAQEKTAASSEQEAQLQTAAAAECTSSGLDAGSASSRQEAAAALCATQQFGSPTEEEPGTAGSGFTAEHESIAEDCGTEQRVPLNALPAHERKLSGGSSKSGNPYASSCGANRAGSAGGSPSGSMDGPEGSGALLQHELSGNPFAPPGTLRSRPASPFVEPGPRHARSLSLQPADLAASAALSDYSASLSLPHPTYTALTGAQLYHMHESPLPEDGEVFRPAKDILQEIFFSRGPQATQTDGPAPDAAQPLAYDAAPGDSPSAEEAPDDSAENECDHQQKLFADAAEDHESAKQPCEKDTWEGDLPEQAQAWEPMWGATSQASLPAPAPSDLSSADAVQSLQAADSWTSADVLKGSKSEQQPSARDSWEAAWKSSQVAKAPDQAAVKKSVGPKQDTTWDQAWGSAQLRESSSPEQSFTLLLPSREPPPPPPATALLGASTVSVAEREQSAAQQGPPLPTMRAEDRQKCERFYQQGFAEKGGVSASAARPLHTKSGSRAPFEAIWELVSPGPVSGPVSASLDCGAFCLFMHLLKTSMKGIALPASILPEQAKELIGASSELASASAARQPAEHSIAEPAAQPATGCEASGRRPSTAESPGGELFSQARSGTLPGIARPASAASSSGNLSPGLSPCGALVAKAVREVGREGAGQVWQPLASRQMDAWAPVQAPTHSLSAPAVWPQAQVPSLPHQGQLRRHVTGIPSPQRACPALPSPRSSEGSPTGYVGARARRPSQQALQPDSAKLSITVDGARVEYGRSLDRPLFSVSLHDASGKRLEAAQDSPPGQYNARTHTISAGHALQFKTPMRQIPPESVVYIEVKHWKSTSKKMSTLGWSFAPIEMFIDASSENAIARTGQLFLHLYKKPISFSAHAKNAQLKQLHTKGHDLFLTLN